MTRKLPVLYRGVWIPRIIMEDKNLRIFEKVILALILSLSNNQNEMCFASNGYMGTCLNYSSRRIQQLLNTLSKKKYIEVRSDIHRGMNNQAQRGVYVLSPDLRNSVRTDIILDKNVLIDKNPEIEKSLEKWFNYLNEQDKILTQATKNAMYDKLLKISKGNIEIADQIIMQSIESGWKNLFPLTEKTTKTGKVAEGVVLKPSKNNNFTNFKF